MDFPSQRLAHQQADHAAVITALRAVRERLHEQRISARIDDPEALAGVAFMLIDITVAVMLRERQEAGRTEDEARADAIEWLAAQVAHTEIELLESGPCSTRPGRYSATGYPEKKASSYPLRTPGMSVCRIAHGGPQSRQPEVVARYRIRVGRKIGSAALVADGLHTRTDGFTSLAVLPGVAGVALGWDWADPVVGLVITVAILAVLRQAAREIYRRLTGAVDPALVDQEEQSLRATPGVLDAGRVRLCWIGHRLRAECEVIVDAGASAVQAHRVAVGAEHNLLHALPRLAAALVHAGAQAQAGDDHHAVLASHR